MWYLQLFQARADKRALFHIRFPGGLGGKSGQSLIFQYDGGVYLITVVYYSLFFEVDKMESTDSGLSLTN